MNDVLCQFGQFVLILPWHGVVNYRMIRLNHLQWQSYAEQRNPVASALMAKMKMKRQERPQAKLACLRLMSQLRLNLARFQPPHPTNPN